MRKPSGAAEKLLHLLFEAGVYVKALTGTIETVAGTLLFFVSPLAITRVVDALVRDELAEDPTSFTALHAQGFFEGPFLHSKVFAAVYLLLHGIFNLILAAGLWKNKLWAYKFAIGIMGAFITYQAYRVGSRGSLGLGALTVFDMFFIFLVWHEYLHRVRASARDPGVSKSAP